MKAHELIDYIDKHNLHDCDITFIFQQQCSIYPVPTEYRRFSNVEVSDVSYSEQILQLTGDEE